MYGGQMIYHLALYATAKTHAIANYINSRCRISRTDRLGMRRSALIRFGCSRGDKVFVGS